MRKNLVIGWIVLALAGAGMVWAATFTDVNSSRYWGKTGMPALTAAIDANNAMIEEGTVSGNFLDLTINDTMTAISTNDADTNIIITANALLDLEFSEDGSLLEAALAAVDAAVDEDFLTYEDTTGDFEWQSASDVAAAIAAAIGEGELADNIILTADIKDGEIVNADLNAAAAIAHTKLAAVEPEYIIVGNASSQAVAVAVSGDIGMGNDGTVTLTADNIDNADINTAAAIAHTKLATDGIGTVVAAIASAAEESSALTVTTITFTNTTLTATDGTDEGESVKVFDCDDGAYTLLGAIVNGTVVVSAGATGTFVLAFGSAAAGDDGALTSTEVDFIPSTAIDTTGGTVLTNDFDAILAVPANFDGTSSAIDIFYNFAILDVNMDDDVTNTITGTLTLITTKVIDNQ